MTSVGSHVNREYYERVPPGRHEYWRKMAACRHRVDVLLTQLREHRPQSVIDLGCGDGALLEEIALALPNAKLAGIDLSTNQTRRNASKTPTVSWHACNLDGSFSLPSERSKADALVATELIEHLDFPASFLRSARELGTTECRLYLSTQSGPLRETERRVGHRRHYRDLELRELLLETGWMPVRIWNTGFPFHNLSKWAANLAPGLALQQFGEKPYGLRENFACWLLRQAFRLNSRSHGAQLFAIADKAK